MSNTLVTILDDSGLRVPSVPDVEAVHGSGITLQAEAGAATDLYFNSETAWILVPKPSAHRKVHAGAQVSYSFGDIGRRPYSVILQPEGDSVPETYDFGSAMVPPMLQIQVGPGMSFPVPDNSTQT